MDWQIEFASGALSDLFRPEKHVAWCIVEFLRERMESPKNIRQSGKMIVSQKLGEFWKYRVGKYRIIVRIEYLTVYVLSVKIGDFPNTKRKE